MVAETGPPTVSGISPAEGPPGTVVKIRGENLGNDQADVLGVFICNVNCTYTAEWKSSRLIHARTGMGLGMGDIIVFTKSNGMGNSMVKFRGYMPRVGLLTEAAVWVDESKLFEEKPTTTLSNSRAFNSPSSTYVDPLGVAPEETGAILPADQIEAWYPELSSNPLSENFNPSRFLLERHLDTSFDALKSGYYHLQSQDTRSSVGPSSFVRGNLTTILDSLFTLNDVQKSMVTHESESIGGNICEELQGVLQSCNFASNSLFKDILSRKDDCDSKRNVLNVLHRYRFLFNLPRSIEKNIQQGEYEILISDYNRAKALFQNTEVKSFKKALNEVDQKISAFSKKLKQKLFDFPTPLEEQKKLIRYLNDLDYPGNAGWECIKTQALWIKSLLLDCQVEHQMQASTYNQLTAPMNDFRLRDSPLTDFRSTSLPGSLKRLQTDTANAPLGILMVEELCKLILENLPDLWNLGQTYIAYQLGDKKENVKKANNDRDSFQSLVKDVIVVYCEMVQTVLQPIEEINRLSPEKMRKCKILVPWLPGAVKSVRSTLQRLTKLGLTADVMSPLKALTTTCIGDCIKKVLYSTVEDVRNLCRQEKWEMEYERKNHYWISKLPSMFEKIFNESIKFVHDFMVDSQIDTKNESRQVYNDVFFQLRTMLEEFLLTLERTVYPDLTDSSEQLNVSIEEIEGGVSKDMQVTLLLSNCYHVRDTVIPNIIDLCIKNDYDEIIELKEEIDTAIDKLDERVFATYVEIKGEPLVGSIELGMNIAEYDWDGAQPVKGVRPYIKDIIMKLVCIHGQVSSVSNRFNKRVFVTLIDLIVDELQRIFECIDTFSIYGTLQANLELQALKHALELHISEKSSLNMDAMIQKLPLLEEKLQKKLKNMLDAFNETMRYQLVTFAAPEANSPQDPKEGFASRLRAQSFNPLDEKKARAKSFDKAEHRERSKSKTKAKKKQSWGAQMEIEKTGSPPKTLSVLTESRSDAASKKTKRRAPPPPSILSGEKKTNEIKIESSNPFFDDDDDDDV